MGDTLREAAASIARTISQTFAFAGRSRRLDIAYYWIAWIVAGALASAVETGLDLGSAGIAREAVQLFATIPFFALFARRLHDQGRSGWWTFMLPPVVAADVYNRVRVTFHAFDPAWPDLGMWGLALLIPVLLSLGFMLIPGEIGENRYGPDPRLAGPEPGTA